MASGDFQPPVINFKMQPREDRAQSITAGSAVMVDVPFVELIPPGLNGKTKVEYNYVEWLERIKKEAAIGDEYNPSRFPSEWVDRIEVAFARWMKDQEQPVFGTALKNWPALTPSEAKNAEGCGFQTVEQLAQANDDAMQRLGLGGRALVTKAQSYVSAKSNDVAKIGAQLAELATRVDNYEAENKRLDSDNKALRLENETLKATSKLPPLPKAA